MTETSPNRFNVKRSEFQPRSVTNITFLSNITLTSFRHIYDRLIGRCVSVATPEKKNFITRAQKLSQRNKELASSVTSCISVGGKGYKSRAKRNATPVPPRMRRFRGLSSEKTKHNHLCFLIVRTDKKKVELKRQICECFLNSLLMDAEVALLLSEQLFYISHMSAASTKFSCSRESQL